MNSDLKKRLIIFGSVGIGLVVVILLIVWIINLIIGGSMSYDQIETKMKEAAIEYYDNNKQLLPIDGSEVSVDATTLVNTKFMKPLEDLVSDDGVNCTGKVVVKQKDTAYSYIPYLDCGVSYTTVEFYKKIIDNKNIVTAGNGLYQMNDEYVFRGEDVNNFVKINDQLWRIVKVLPNNDIQLIFDGLTLKSDWDNRYNVDRDYNVGINDFSVSRIRNYLEELYSQDTIFNDFVKDKMVVFDVCYGKRGFSETNNNGSIECSMVLENQKVGLLPIYDYVNASLDNSCAKLEDRQCQNYNYLTIGGSPWWTITASSENTYRVFTISSSGYPQANNASSTASVRPVIHLSSSALYSSGSGTELDPYTVK